MILILSGDGDVSTDLVVGYLKDLGYSYFRINSFDLLNGDFDMAIGKTGDKLRVRGNDIDVHTVGAVWYRKFGFYRKSKGYQGVKSAFGPDFAENMSREFSSVLGGLVSLFKDRNWLTTPESTTLNKLAVLRMAKEVGLNIPESFLFTNRSRLHQKLSQAPLITKSIWDPWVVRDELGRNEPFSMFTTEIEEEELKLLPDNFFPSLVQKKIEKKYEIRSFYILGSFFSMAIFSQLDKQTSVDFRRYNWDQPNRSVPYFLPKYIERQLSALMKHLTLNCCSIDLIRGTDDKYYFLEVNPTGQFGMIDFSCNYNLHQLVANTLIDLDKKAI